MKKDGKRKIWYVIGIIVAFLLCGALGFYIGVILPMEQDTPVKGGEVISQGTLNTITYEGKKYRYNTNLMNVLFLGIDNGDEASEENLPGEAGQSDCIMVISLNKETKEGRILQIPRDTITEVDIFDSNGNCFATVEEQVANQYAYAGGGKDSCWASKKTVAELLNGLQIDAYLSIDMASIPIINDAAGGVTLTIPEDYTDVDPAFEKGAVVTLTGQQSYDYVRYRDIEEDFSNNERMQRQQQYIPALITAIRKKVGSGSKYYETFYPLVEKYMVTDLTADQMNELGDYELATSEVEMVPGEGRKGEVYEEFHVDEENLQKILIKMFYISVE